MEGIGQGQDRWEALQSFHAHLGCAKLPVHPCVYQLGSSLNPFVIIIFFNVGLIM